MLFDKKPMILAILKLVITNIVSMYLNCHSYYSFLYGTMSPRGLFEEARRCGVRKLVLTDINNTAGYVEFLRICEERKSEYHLELALGVEMRSGHNLFYVAIAADNAGFEELNRFISQLNEKKMPPAGRAPAFDRVYVVYPFGLRPLPALADHEFVGVRTNEVALVGRSGYAKCLDKLVVFHPVTFSRQGDCETHRLMRAISENTILSKVTPEMEARRDEQMMPENQLRQYYQQYPQIIMNTSALLDACTIHFQLGTAKSKRHAGGSRAEDRRTLRNSALQGLLRRYGPRHQVARQRLNKELDIIAAQDLESYFLITMDIINYARHRNFAYVGRGSGANSIVAYSLGITEVDPLELDLYFERFLNPYRAAPPDFDIDFSWKDRDEVIGYLMDKHSKDHTAQLATYNTLQGRSIIRELGKVFGLPGHEIDQIAERPFEMRNKDDISRLIFHYADRLQDVPRNLSVHAGGLVITEAPIYAYTATLVPPKGFPITHFDMYGAEDLGIHKFDLLSQRGLGHIRDAVAIVEQNRGKKIDISQTDRFKHDPLANKLLQQGNCMGCFYIESPAMRMLLQKLRCDNYATLVAASSVIRPGVARSGMMRAYIQRHRTGRIPDTVHPTVHRLLKETYGVMVYQEDVLKVAHEFAGISLALADVLRRGMSGKYRSLQELQRVQERFFAGCLRRGYPEEVTQEVWRQIRSFAGYSFSKAHSASYAVESYQSLYLKAHYPLEFFVAVINNFGGFYATEFYFREAIRAGAKVEVPSVNDSDYITKITGRNIHMGFVHLKSLKKATAMMIVQVREAGGSFSGLEDFVHRVPIGLEQLNILIRIGAFRFSGSSKRALLWKARLLYGRNQLSHSRPLFDARVSVKMPELDDRAFEDAFDELELLGFTIENPFFMLKTADLGHLKATDLMQHKHELIELVGYLVAIKSTHTKNHMLMHFATFIDEAGDVFDTTHFPTVARQYPFKGKGFYRLVGKVVDDFDCPMVEVSQMHKEATISKYEQVRSGIGH
jgi:DNA-directed DNA polymerase III PolC